MSRLCLVDFDDILILTDSLRKVMNSEHWLYSPSLIAAGVKLFFCRAIRRGEAKARDRFKAGMLRRFKELPEEKVSDYEYAFERVCLVAHGDFPLSFVAGIELTGGEMVSWHYILCNRDYLLFVIQKTCGQNCKSDEQCEGHIIGGKPGMTSEEDVRTSLKRNTV